MVKKIMAGLLNPIREVIGDPYKRLKWARRVLQQVAENKTEDIQSWDVWQWTRRKYRIRAIILLLINALLFAGLGCFTFWLRTGEYSPFATQHYKEFWWEAFNPTSEEQITLVDFLTYPIPVDQVPMMVIVVGLVLASLTAIPILVSMLYRFRFSLIFVAIIGAVAVLPWMAFTVTICCYLVRWKRIQFSFRYATALLSMLHLVAYYALSTRNASIAGHVPPVELAKLYLPCILAIIAACVLIAVVMIIVKLVNFRPGAIAPLMAVMFTTPVVLFETEVGHDELYYRLIESRFGSDSRTYFVDHVNADTIIQKIAIERYENNEDPQVTLTGIMDQIRLALQLRLASGNRVRDEVDARIAELFAEQKHVAIAECRNFRRHNPDSRYIPNVLYLQGRAVDMRLDEKFMLIDNQLVLRHYNDFPAEASKPLWQELYDRFADNPLASVAAYRLAQLEVRQGHTDKAVQLLDALIERFSDYVNTTNTGESSGSWANFLAKRRASGKLDVEPTALVHEARIFRELLVNNRDPQYNDQPLRRLLNFDSRHAMFRNNLKRLLADLRERYRLSPLADNIELLLINSEPSRSRKIEQLKAFVHKHAENDKSDVLAAARIMLGVVYQTDNRPEEAKALFEEVIRYHPQSPWVREANRHLGEISVTALPVR